MSGRAATHHALCVGVAAYADNPLRNPVNDARVVGAALRGVGFAVTILENPSLDQLVDAVESFVAALRPGGTAVFMFAGHGAQAEDGSNYLIPVKGVKSDAHLESSALRAGKVLERMQTADSRLNVLLLDACRSYGMRRGARCPSSGLSKMEASRGSVLAFACAPGQTAGDGGGDYGVFTSQLLQHLPITSHSSPPVLEKHVLVEVSATPRAEGQVSRGACKAEATNLRGGARGGAGA